MSELFEKLRKRREEVDVGGLHFESTPLTDGQPPSASAKEGTAARALGGGGGNGPRVHHNGGSGAGGAVDFQSAINKRRAQVDGDSQTFESKPAERTADCTSGDATAAAASSKSGKLEAGRFCSGSGGDFQEVIGLQRARVDAGAGTWENTPSGEKADTGHNIGPKFYPRSQQGPPLAVASVGAAAGAAPPAAERATSSEKAAPSEPEPSAPPAAAAAPEAEAEEAEAPAPEAPSPRGGAPEEEARSEPSAAAPAPAPAPAAAAEATAASGEEDDDDEREELRRVAEADAAASAAPAASGGGAAAAGASVEDEAAMLMMSDQVMTVKGNRITWLVELGNPPMPEVLESPAFQIRGYEGASLKLYPNGASGTGDERCTLVLQGPSPRPDGLQVMLFAGKGWKQRNLKPWPDGEEMVEKFDVCMERHFLLCGLVFNQM